jgi:hypothetical protein
MGLKAVMSERTVHEDFYFLAVQAIDISTFFEKFCNPPFMPRILKDSLFRRWFVQ